MAALTLPAVVEPLATDSAGSAVLVVSMLFATSMVDAAVFAALTVSVTILVVRSMSIAVGASASADDSDSGVTAGDATGDATSVEGGVVSTTDDGDGM